MEGQDSLGPEGRPVLAALEGISLARSSSRVIPRSAIPRPGAMFPQAGFSPSRADAPAAPRYPYESDDDLLGPEEFGPIVFRDGIFQIDDIAAGTRGALDPKLKRLIDSILDPDAGGAEL
jgi:hypothetical protein